MVNLEQLRARGLRAYELGRLRSASRAVWLLGPLAAACGLVTGAGEKCACLGVVLIGSAIFLRWRSRMGAQSVSIGVLAGVAPLLASLALARVAPSCAGAPLVSWCTAVSLAVGLPAGIWLGRRIASSDARISSLLATAGIGTIAASLGCIGLGFAAVLGAGAGLLLGGASALALTKRAAA